MKYSLLLLTIFFIGCKTAEPFDGSVDDGIGWNEEQVMICDTLPKQDTPIDSLLSQLKDIYAVPADTANYRYLDTIKALLLCGDTSRFYTGTEGWYEIDPQCYWQAGYIVIERFAAWAKFSWLFTPAEPVFLDRRKQELKPNIVVWMVKEIN